MTLGSPCGPARRCRYLALEANAEAAKKQKRYNLKLTGRAMFQEPGRLLTSGANMTNTDEQGPRFGAGLFRFGFQ